MDVSRLCRRLDVLCSSCKSTTSTPKVEVAPPHHYSYIAPPDGCIDDALATLPYVLRVVGLGVAPLAPSLRTEALRSRSSSSSPVYKLLLSTDRLRPLITEPPPYPLKLLLRGRLPL